MKLPNLFVPGAAKSGTSTLHLMLNDHPDIFMSRFKEPSFFANDEPLWGRVGYRDGLEKYVKEYFEGADEAKIIGESSTVYLYNPIALKRIEQDVPNAKFIVCFRNPIERFLSHYNWLYHLKSEDRSISTILDLYEKGELDETETDDFYRGKNYIKGGLYGSLFRDMLKYIKSERIHGITYSALVHRPNETMNSCFRFLGLSEMDQVKLVKSNSSGELKYPKLNQLAMRLWYGLPGLKQREKLLDNPNIRKIRNTVFSKKPTDKIELSFEQRSRLRKIYEPEVALLRQLTGKNFLEWNEDFPIDKMNKASI
jgi:hypothetical protein